MMDKNTVKLFTILILSGLTIFGLISLSQAQEDENHTEVCDMNDLLTHWAEHSVVISDFPQSAQEDLDAALEELYITGIAYQALATQCGFSRLAAAQAEHDAQHGIEALAETVAPEVMELALSIGDPENGQVLFNTIQPETGFACATCHRVDSTERLIGPGLLGVADPAHDPSEHAGGDDHAAETGGDHDMEAGDDQETGDDHEADDMHMDMGDEDEPMTMDMGGSSDAAIDYVRTSILNPSAFVVPDYPDHLMPAIYSDVFSEDEINDLIAYLVTVR